MPARKRRRDLSAVPQAQAGLRDAAARAERLLDWLEAAKPVEASGLPPLVEAKPAPARRRLWPFGRKVDPETERIQAILAELESVADGHPSAAARARQQAPQPDALLTAEQRLRAAG